MATRKTDSEVSVLDGEAGTTGTGTNETSPTTPSTDKAEVPKPVDKLLQIYPKYEKLYVDEKGGVFVNGSKLPANHKVTLYTNPYFKK